MNEQWFIINNFDEFIDASRSIIYNSFGKDFDKDDKEEIEKLLDYNKPDREELDKCLSHEESATIAKTVVKKEINKYTDEITYSLTDSQFMKFLELLNDRMVSNILNNLANMGLVESAYDNDSDDFIFWIKDEYKEEIEKIIEKPETD